MSRKALITLAAVTLTAATLASGASYARGFSGFHFGGARFGGTHYFAGVNHFAGRPTLARFHLAPTHPFHLLPIRFGHHDHHWHWVFRGGRWIEADDVVDVETVDAAPVVATPVPAPAPCTCLTKTYTPTGLVVFADICTKESASAPADGSAGDASQAPTTQPTQPQATQPQQSQAPAPTSYAGRTYQDYLAANPQAAVQAPAKN